VKYGTAGITYNILSGYLEELKLIIPWTNIINEPVRIIIDRIYLLSNPKNEANVNCHYIIHVYKINSFVYR
jgi:hypothetical protein